MLLVVTAFTVCDERSFVCLVLRDRVGRVFLTRLVEGVPSKFDMCSSSGWTAVFGSFGYAFYPERVE